MKLTKKTLFTGLAIACFSAAVAGLTTYVIMPKTGTDSSNKGSFTEMFQQNPNVKLASYSVAEAQPVDLTLAAENSVHAVVHIAVVKQVRQRYNQRQQPDIFEWFFGPQNPNQQYRRQQPEQQRGAGSGVILSKDGYIVTNNHVVEGADELTVKLNDNREFKARLIGTDAVTDIALIKIEGDDFPTLPVGDSDALKIGEWVLAVGNPFNLSSTVTAGIVSAKARRLDVYRQSNTESGIEAFIQTDAAINPGNSGGALVNAKGELVGINAVLASPTGTFSGYGFAIPTSIMTNVVADLKQYGIVQRAMLGVNIQEIGADRSDWPEETRKEAEEREKGLNLNSGLLITNIVDGGSASTADIQTGDVIIGLNNREIKSFADLQEALAMHRPGDKVKVKLLRDKKEKIVEVVLKNEQGTTKLVKNVDMEMLGAAFRELPDETKQQLRLSYGLEVTGVTSGKFQSAGIRKGFIILKANGTNISTLDDLQEAMKAASKTPEQVLFISGIFPSGKRGNYAVDLSTEQ
ncbi:MAG: Do family serine endopeptidase [Prevotellaceae bacterium]|jgi:Do/DeqQ family serine protease|nr:Do family serine endopeptidase [Prevotellaceae bacterium]